MTTNSETVLGVYEAFGRGDLPYILDQLADDIRWDHGIRSTDLPYLQPGTGKDHVTAFFKALSENLEFTTFEPMAPCFSDNMAIVAVREAGRNLVTGAALAEDLAVHIWTFGDDGKILEFRHVGDFAAHEKAASGPKSAAVAGT